VGVSLMEAFEEAVRDDHRVSKFPDKGKTRPPPNMQTRSGTPDPRSILTKLNPNMRCVVS